MTKPKIKEMVNLIESALITRNVMRMRELSNEASDLATLSQDREMIELAVASYALNKILGKIHFQEEVDQLYHKTKPDFDAGHMRAVLDKIKTFDLTHGMFQGDIIEKARIKIGSRLYAKGLSLTRSAELAGASGGDILTFSGKTRIHEEKKFKPVVERIQVARRLFK